MDTLDRLVKAGFRYRQARDRTEVARANLRDAIWDAAKTMSEAEIARDAGVTRMTVRKALGK